LETTLNIFFEAVGQATGDGLFHPNQGFVEIFHERGFLAVGGGIASDSFHLVSHDKSAVKEGFFAGTNITEHNFKERVEGNNFHCELVFVGFFGLGEIKGIKAGGRVKTKVDIGALKSGGKFPVFVFGVDDNHFGFEKK